MVFAQSGKDNLRFLTRFNLGSFTLPLIYIIYSQNVSESVTLLLFADEIMFKALR